MPIGLPMNCLLDPFLMGTLFAILVTGPSAFSLRI